MLGKDLHRKTGHDSFVEDSQTRAIRGQEALLVVSTFLKIVAISAVFLLASCATDDGTRLGSEPAYPYETSNADAASYGSDGFTFNKKMNVRAPNDFMFYYKRCSLTGERSYYSRTDYFCTEP